MPDARSRMSGHIEVRIATAPVRERLWSDAALAEGGAACWPARRGRWPIPSCRAGARQSGCAGSTVVDDHATVIAAIMLTRQTTPI